MGVEFSYERFQKTYLELSSMEKPDNVLGIKMATDAPVAVLVNNYSYDELLTSFRRLNEKVDRVSEVANLIDKLEENLSKIVRVKTRRMW